MAVRAFDLGSLHDFYELAEELASGGGDDPIAWEHAKERAAAELDPLNGLIAFAADGSAEDRVELTERLLDEARAEHLRVTDRGGALAVELDDRELSIDVRAPGLYALLRIAALVDAAMRPDPSGAAVASECERTDRGSSREGRDEAHGPTSGASPEERRVAVVSGPTGEGEPFIVVGEKRDVARAIERRLVLEIPTPTDVVVRSTKRASSVTKAQLEEARRAIAAAIGDAAALERVIAGLDSAIVSRFAGAIRYEDDYLLASHALEGIERATIPMLCEAATRGDPRAVRTVEGIRSLSTYDGSASFARFVRLERLRVFASPAGCVTPAIDRPSTLATVELEGTFATPIRLASPNVRRITIAGAKLERMPLLHAPILEELEIRGLDHIEAIGLLALPSLRTLRLAGCFTLTSLAGIEGAPGLRRLALYQAFKLRSLTALTALPELEELEIPGCDLDDLTPLAACRRLRVLSIPSNGALTTLDALRSCEGLEELDVSGCFGLTDASALGSLPLLRRVSIDDDVPGVPEGIERT